MDLWALLGSQPSLMLYVLPQASERPFKKKKDYTHEMISEDFVLISTCTHTCAHTPLARTQRTKKVMGMRLQIGREEHLVKK